MQKVLLRFLQDPVMIFAQGMQIMPNPVMERFSESRDKFPGSSFTRHLPQQEYFYAKFGRIENNSRVV